MDIVLERLGELEREMRDDRRSLRREARLWRNRTVVLLGAVPGSQGGDLVLANQTGREVVRLGVQPDSGGFARVMDATGRSIFTQPQVGTPAP